MNWLEAARERFGGPGGFPLIDDREIVEEKAVYEHWPWFGGRERDADRLRQEALRVDHLDLPVRFVYLNLFYRLAHYPAEQVAAVVEDQNSAPVYRAEFEHDLEVLVGLVDVEECTDARQIQWEIVNACAVNEYDRALRLVGRLGALLPASTVHCHLGRLHFLIAVRNIWEGEVALEYWDLPLGKRPGGDRGAWRAIYAGHLHTAGIQLWPTRGLLTEGDRDHLRDAIKHLEKTTDMSEVPPSTRFMLALSYAWIGDGHNAARHYQWMVNNQQRFLSACAQEEGALWGLEVTDAAASLDVFINGIHRCLVNAYDDAGETDNAINAANAWITACPDHVGTYVRMARLCQKRTDYQAAAEWFQKEADRNPSLKEDPNISIILALGSIGTAARMDEALTKIANAHPNEHAIVESVVNSYWPAFANLATEGKQKWALGDLVLNSNLPGGAGVAAHCFAWVVERELHTTIFAPFKDDAKGRPGLFTLDDEDSKPFVDYLTGRTPFDLGQMLWTLNRAREPRTPLHSTFAQWLNGKNPMLLPRFATVRADTIRTFRNREDHADLLSITMSDAEIMNRRCRHLINLLHPR